MEEETTMMGPQSMNDKKTGLINKIRGLYTHRDYHYLAEFNYICKIQNISGDLRVCG